MRKLPLEACSLIDLFADVSISLARLHWVVGRGRCELDELVTAVTRQVKERTTTVVGTVGAATRPRGAADVGFPPGVSLSVLAIDEATRTDRFQLDRLFETLKRWLSPATAVAVAADPCQLSVKSKAPSCTQRLVANHDVDASMSRSVLNAVVQSNMTSDEIVERLDLRNRERSGLRCRTEAARFVSTLAPFCLPGGSDFWNRIVGGQRLWSPLRPRGTFPRPSPPPPIDAFMDRLIPEIILFRAVDLPNLSHRARVMYVGHSRVDMEIALSIRGVCDVRWSEVCTGS